jgi:hypothetical protein
MYDRLATRDAAVLSALMSLAGQGLLQVVEDSKLDDITTPSHIKPL